MRARGEIADGDVADVDIPAVGDAFDEGFALAKEKWRDTRAARQSANTT